MKNAIAFFFALILFPNLNAQTQDSIYTKFESKTFSIIHNLSQNKYQINGQKGNLLYTDLKYVERVKDSYQVIDAENEIFILDATTLEKKEKAENIYWVCGTVPHYTLAVEEQKDSFAITIDETFYDMMGEIPAEEFMKISKEKADSIVFINGQNTFNYSANFSYTTQTINPQTVILVKDGKYSVAGAEGIQYDSIDFTGYAPIWRG